MRMCFLLHCFSSGYSWLSPGSCPWGCRHSSPRCFQSPAQHRVICVTMTSRGLLPCQGFVSWVDACHCQVPSRRVWCRPHKHCSRLPPVVASGHTCVTKDNFLDLLATCIVYIPVHTCIYMWYTYTCITKDKHLRNDLQFYLFGFSIARWKLLSPFWSLKQIYVRIGMYILKKAKKEITSLVVFLSFQNVRNTCQDCKVLWRRPWLLLST